MPSKYSLIVRLTSLTSLNIKFRFFWVTPCIIGRYLQTFRMTLLRPYLGAKIYETESCHAHIITHLLVTTNYQELWRERSVSNTALPWKNYEKPRRSSITTGISVSRVRIKTDTLSNTTFKQMECRWLASMYSLYRGYKKYWKPSG